jgi:hypothetical protein
MKKMMFLLAFSVFLVGFQAKSAHATTPIGVPECGGNPGYVTCVELMGVISGPPVSIQNLGLEPCFPDPNPTPGWTGCGPEGNGVQCRISWSNGYSIQQVAITNNSCSQTYGSEVLGSWKSWGENLPAGNYTAPIVPTP